MTFEVVYPNGKTITKGAVFEDALFASSGKTCLLSPGKVRIDGLVLRRCALDGLKEMVSNTEETNFWGARLRGVMSGLIEDCIITAFKEHGLYIDVLGRLTIRKCSFRAGAQAIQVEDREFSASGERIWPEGYTLDQMGDLRIEECLFDNCGQPRGAGRASFAVTLYRESGHHVLSRCSWVHGPKEPGVEHSVRGLMFRSGESLEVRGCSADYAETDVPFFDLRAPGSSILIVRCNFARGVIRIGDDVESVLIKGCTGDAVIQTPEGEKVPVANGYTL